MGNSDRQEPPNRLIALTALSEDGGDLTRKRKLLEKQRLGNVEIPQEAFMSLLLIGK